MIKVAEKPEDLVSFEKEYRGWGYTVVPCDDPDRGIQGLMASKEEGGKEVSTWCQVAMFGAPLTPDIKVVPTEELLTWARAQEGHLKVSDAPEKLLMGFVSYKRAEEGRSETRRVRMVEAKTSGLIGEVQKLRILIGPNR